uniref:RING-type E3 ubiquitin transferase n=1 Tax=Steinernema glaseri TaxID=37863 RepID=A0A1I7YQX9_9BILA
MDDEEEVCRICYEDGSENPLFHPCKCSGSAKHIHQSCWQRILKHRSTTNNKCDVCLYEIESAEVTVNEGLVTWNIYIQALAKYLLSLFLVLLSFVPWAAAATYTERPYVTALSSFLAFLNRNRIGKYFFGDEYEDRQLPSILCDDRNAKIGDVSSWKIIKHDGILLVLNAAAAVIYLLIAYLLVMALSSLSLPSAVDTNATEYFSGVTEFLISISISHWNYILFSIAVVLILISYLGIVNTVLTIIHALLVGSVVMPVVANFCYGRINEAYHSELVYLKLLLMICIGRCLLLFIRQFCHVYFENTEVAHEERIILEWSSYISLRENVERNTKLLFLVAVLLYQAELRYDWGLKAQKYVYKNVFGYERQTNTRLSVGLDIVLWTPILSITVTLFYWFLGHTNKRLSVGLDIVLWTPILSIPVTLFYWFIATLGRSVFLLGLTPAYFEIYRHDVLAHMIIGLLTLRLVSSTLPALVKDAIIYTSSFCLVFAYVMCFTTIEDYLYRAETVFVFFTIFGTMLLANLDDVEKQGD